MPGITPARSVLRRLVDFSVPDLSSEVVAVMCALACAISQLMIGPVWDSLMCCAEISYLAGAI